MSHLHYLRVGVMGQVGRFASVDFVRYERGARVVCRTERGLEVGEVLSTVEKEGAVDGSILRKMTSQDHLLHERLDRHRLEALEACHQLLSQHDNGTILMDVEHLLDGENLYFYFLGEIPGEVTALMRELAETYDAKARIGRFAETLTEGCGPGCGTEDAENGCASGACSTCAVVDACRDHG